MPTQRPSLVCDRGPCFKRPSSHEARQLALTANAIEECNTLRLRTECQFSARGSFEREVHEVLADPASLIVGIDENLGNGGKEIAIRQNANAADQTRAVPSSEVNGSLECRARVGDRIVAGP